jgi:hypothetical protein
VHCQQLNPLAGIRAGGSKVGDEAAWEKGRERRRREEALAELTV